jgi:hypothetical protein
MRINGNALLRWAWLLLLAFVFSMQSALAQGIESVVSPGDVISGHAKFEKECKQCHVMFDRAAQDKVCMDCHKEIAQDVRAKTGFHGLMKRQACRTCHTDHKGRNASIASFDKKLFDHSQTDFALRGKHQKIECVACHEVGKKFRQAATQCNACHKKDDVHKGSLGAACADCHTESSWKDAKFDHNKTEFPLTGKHVETKCTDCHKDKFYQDTPHACVACHKKDDERKGHKGQFGEKCESCHGTKSWRATQFNHDTDTRYALRGKHQAAKCTSCHAGPLYKTKVSQQCVDCHKNDDKHKGTLGTECAACHTEKNWKESPKFDHDKTIFPLFGKHLKQECKACHKTAVYKEAPKECVACHKKDDKHEGNVGVKCDSCHSERDWKEVTRFDHNRTRFALRNAHAQRKVQCKDCHSDIRHYRDTSMECVSCHKKDDRHEGQQGWACEQCHSDQSWKVASFNHSRTKFPLLGKHGVAACKDCHVTARFKDAKSDCYSCHKKEDKHRLKFGTACETCHNPRTWGSWDFNHDKRTRYKLDGAHRKVKCEACHREPASTGKPIFDIGKNCISCHRKDDVHDGSFGAVCEKCHTTTNWKDMLIRAGQQS